MAEKRDKAAELELRLAEQVRQLRREGHTNEQIMDDLCISKNRLQRLVRLYAIPLMNSTMPSRELRASLRRM